MFFWGQPQRAYDFSTFSLVLCLQYALKLCLKYALNWFKVNSMAANPGKFQIMFLGWKIDNSKITFCNRKQANKM